MVSRKSGLISLLLLTQLLLFPPLPAGAWETEILTQNDQGLTLRLSGITGELQVNAGSITCSGADLLAVAVDSTIKLGQKTLFVAIPSQASPHCQVTAVQWVTLGLAPPGHHYYQLLEGHAPAKLRQQQLLPLTLRPFRVLKDGTVQLAVELTFRVDFNRAGGKGDPLLTTLRPEAAPFERKLQSLLVNYEQGRLLRSAPQPQARPFDNSHPDTTVKIYVEEDGVYRVGWNWLSQQGLTLDAAVSGQLRLFTYSPASGTVEVPIKMFDGQDGYFDPGDFFVFWGERQRGEFSDRNRYTPKSAYFLRYYGQPGARMVDVNAALLGTDYHEAVFFHDICHMEEDLIYDKLRDFPTDESARIDHWYWRKYQQSGIRDVVNLSLYDPYHQDPLVLNTIVRSSFTSLSYTQGLDHHVLCELNGYLFAGEIWWTQLRNIITEFVIPDSVLLEEGNQLVLYIPGDANQDEGYAEQTYLNWVEVEYERRFAARSNRLDFRREPDDRLYQYQVEGFTDQNLILFDSNGRWLSGFDISQQEGKYAITFQDDYPWEVDYHAATYSSLQEPFGLVITPWEDLKTAAQPVDYIIIYPPEFETQAQQWTERWNERYSVRPVNIENIYDTFGRGTMAPEPIRDFLAYAWENWSAPAFSYALLMGRGSYMYDKLQARHASYLETLMPVYLDIVPATTVTPSDEYFACFVGDDELQDCYIGRLSLTSASEFSDYYDKMLEYDFNYDPGLWHLTHTLISDESESFSRPNHNLVTYRFPTETNGTIIDIEEDSPYHGGNYELRQLIDAGTTTVSYLGHGGTTLMSAHGILSTSNYQLLLNNGRYPLGFAWSCLAGGFSHESQRSVSELLVKVANKGYIASFGSAALAYSTADTLFLYQYYNSLFLNSHSTLGEISWDAELAMCFSGNLDYHTKMFNLLGDPALRFAAPRREVAVTPATTQLQPDGDLEVTCQLDSSLAGDMGVYLYRDDGLPLNFDPETGAPVPLVLAHLASVVAPVTDGGGTLNLELPEDLPAGFYRLVAYFDNGEIDGVGATRAACERPVLLSATTIPETPAIGDSITFVAEFDPAQPPDSLKIFFLGNHALRDVLFDCEGENGLYHVQLPYSLFTNSPFPIIQRYAFRIFGMNDRWDSPGFTFYTVKQAELDWVKDSYDIDGQDEVALTFELRNVGQAGIEGFMVLVYENVTDTLAVYTGGAIAAGEAVPVTLNFEQEQGEHTLLLEAMNLERSGSILQDLNYLLVGPEGIDDLPLTSFPAYSLSVPAGGLERYIGLLPTLSTITLEEPHTGQPAFLTPQANSIVQSDLFLGLLCDSSLTVASLEIKLELERPLEVAVSDTTTELLPDSILWISNWDSLYSCWVPCLDPVRMSLPDSLHLIQVVTKLPQYFRLHAVTDQTPPHLVSSVSNQFFAPGDDVARSPSFGFTLEDYNGLDYGQRIAPPSLILNGEQLPATEYMLDGHGVWAHLNLSLLELEPDLLHTLRLEALDLAGNTATDSLDFRVSSGFKLLHVASHPNPFSDQTILAWELTDVPQRIQAQIFTTSGRKIRTLEKLNPRIGYDEMIWDGLDDLGRQVANGVYYLKLTAESGGDKAVKTIKLARLR